MTKDVLNTENCKTMLREIKDLNKWRDIQVRRFSIVRMSVFILTSRFNKIPIKIPAGLLKKF